MSIKNLLTARDIHGPFMQLFANLQGENGREWLAALNRFLRKENPWPGETRTARFTVWKTISLGMHKDIEQFMSAFRIAQCSVSYSVNELFSGKMFTLASEQAEVDLVTCSVEELGLKDYVTYEEICATAISLGLKLCPAEVGLALRLAYNDQPRNEQLNIAMEALIYSDFNHAIFCVINDDGEFWLYWRNGSHRHVWRSSDRFVFVLPRK